jgi:4-methylaminobutanoate oxidase (formaldehyde-forming)
MPTDLPSRAQVVIVGGGVIGCSIAYHLAHLGWTDVLLLEQHQLTAGTTWHAAGLITSAGMTDETSLSFSRYSRELYARLEEETGHSTGFRAVGHLSLATTPRRLEALRRSSAWMRGMGCSEVEISGRELAVKWPLARTDDVLAAFYVADEGRADPVGVATALAKGPAARRHDRRRYRGDRVRTKARRVTAVMTERGPVETEILVTAAGIWARQFGALAGVRIPLQAAEHYYLLTGKVDGMDPDLPVIEDPDRYGYYRPEGDGMLVGLFEPRAAAWSLTARAATFVSAAAPDWERWSRSGRHHGPDPVLADTGVRTFSTAQLVTSDVHPMLGPAPELDGDFGAAGLNSIGILAGGGVGRAVAHWIVDGVPPCDVTGYAVERAPAHETSRRFRAERTTEMLGALCGDDAWPAWQPNTARNVRKSVLHDRQAAAGAHFAVSAGWEYPEWFFPGPGEPPATTMDWSRQPAFGLIGEEHAAIRDAAGILDMSLMASFLVQGQDAGTVLSRLSANNVTAGDGRIVYTQWLDRKGGIVADVTVTQLAADRFLVVASDLIHRRIEPLIRRATQPGACPLPTDLRRHAAVRAGARVPRADRGADRRGPVQRRVPYLTAQHIDVGYAPVLAIRVTYVGELGWELHIPAEYALACGTT